MHKSEQVLCITYELNIWKQQALKAWTYIVKMKEIIAHRMQSTSVAPKQNQNVKGFF